jgi:hypothetical protein
MCANRLAPDRSPADTNMRLAAAVACKILRFRASVSFWLSTARRARIPGLGQPVTCISQLASLQGSIRHATEVDQHQQRPRPKYSKDYRQKCAPICSVYLTAREDCHVKTSPTQPSKTKPFHSTARATRNCSQHEFGPARRCRVRTRTICPRWSVKPIRAYSSFHEFLWIGK